MSAPATATGGSGKETLDGTDGDRDAPSMLGMGAPAQMSDMIEVTSQSPIVFPYIQQEHIFDTAFSWSSEDKAGTVLYQKPMHPYFMNPVIAYLSKLFNCWEGGFSIRAIIAGTGFNGGKFGVAWIPPNMDPKTMTVSQFTIFPYCVVDPKMNEQVTFYARDQCIQKVHMMGLKGRPDFRDQHEDDYLAEMAKIGGWLVFFVINPLISASGNSTNVNISVFTAAGEDFTMSQVIPPSISGGDNHITFPNLYLTENWHPNLPFLYGNSLNVYDKSITTAADAWTLVNRNTGKWTIFPNNSRRGLVAYGRGTWSYDSNACNTFCVIPEVETDLKNCPPFHMFINGLQVDMCWTTKGSGDAVKKFKTSDQLYTSYSSDGKTLQFGTDVGSPSHDVVAGTHHVTVDNSRPYQNFTFKAPGLNGKIPKWFTDKLKVQAPNAERICVFGTKSDTYGGFYQTRETVTLLKMRLLKAVDDPVYSLNDKRSDKPLLYMRLNADGFWSTNLTGTTIEKYDLHECYLAYHSMIPTNSRLPQTSPEAREAFQLRQEVKRSARILKSFQRLDREVEPVEEYDFGES